jgi:hypothetical protein
MRILQVIPDKKPVITFLIRFSFMVIFAQYLGRAQKTKKYGRHAMQGLRANCRNLGHAQKANDYMGAIYSMVVTGQIPVMP